MSSISFFFSSRSKPVEESAAGSSEESPDSNTASPPSWLTSPPEMELELEDPQNIPGLGEEELPHMLLPDSLSQLEEFGRHKRPRKVHHGHGRPRLFSDLWVRIEDGWDIFYNQLTVVIFSSMKLLKVLFRFYKQLEWCLSQCRLQFRLVKKNVIHRYLYLCPFCATNNT